MPCVLLSDPPLYERILLGERLDEVSADALMVKIEPKLAPRCRLILDLTAMVQLDDTCVGFLIYLQRRLRWFGGRLRLICPSVTVRQQLSMLGLDQLLPCYDSDAALLMAQQAEEADEASIPWK